MFLHPYITEHLVEDRRLQLQQDAIERRLAATVTRPVMTRALARRSATLATRPIGSRCRRRIEAALTGAAQRRPLARHRIATVTPVIRSEDCP